MTRPNPDAYTPSTEETTRLRNADAPPAVMAGDDPDYEIGRLSPERYMPTSRGWGTGMTANYATRWREGREAERQIDRLTERAEQARKTSCPRTENRSGGIFLPPLPDDAGLELF